MRSPKIPYLLLIPIAILSFLIGSSKKEVALIPTRPLSDYEKQILEIDSLTLQIIYFYDYNCEYCAEFLPALQKVYNHTFRDLKFQFINIHTIPRTEEMVFVQGAICAEQQGSFFEYSKSIYDLKRAGSIIDISKLQSSIFKNGSYKEWTTCIQAHPTKQRVQEIEQLLSELDVSTTPSIIIGEYLFSGVFDYPILSKIIETTFE